MHRGISSFAAFIKVACCMKPYQKKPLEFQYLIYCTANIPRIALWFKMSKCGFFDVCFDPSFQNMCLNEQYDK